MFDFATVATLIAVVATAVIGGVLFGTAVLAITVAIAHPTAWTVAGAALYVLGVIGVTAVANVPRNNALAGVDALAAGAADAPKP